MCVRDCPSCVQSSQGIVPMYLQVLLLVKTLGCYSLHSDTLGLLKVPHTWCETFGNDTFAVAVPRFWNSRPLAIITLMVTCSRTMHIYPVLQSSYGAGHSTATAWLKVMNDMDSKCVTPLVLLLGCHMAIQSENELNVVVLFFFFYFFLCREVFPVTFLLSGVFVLRVF